MAHYPVSVDLQALLRALAREERELVGLLASLEEQLRRYEDLELPRYQAWLRLEFGPMLAELEELHEKIRARRLLAQRINGLIEREGLHPREALHVATSPAAKREPEEAREEPGESRHWDADEVEARRQAKKEAKREARREAKKHAARENAAARADSRGTAPGTARSKLVSLYRALARRLHPDSPHLIASARAPGLWLEVQAAYEGSDLERLLAVAAWIGREDPESAPPEIPALSVSERKERIRSLGASRARLQKRLERLREEPAWGFGSAEQPRLRKLRQRAAREIEDELARAQEALQAYEDFIDSIGPPRPPKRRKS